MSTTVLMATRPHGSSSVSSHSDGNGGVGGNSSGPCGVLPGDGCCSRLGEQCGGVHWHGATCCREGASCLLQHATYSECRLSSSHPDVDVVVTEEGSKGGSGPLFVISITRGSRLLWATALGGSAFVLALVAMIAACSLACRNSRKRQHGSSEISHDESTSALPDARLLSLTSVDATDVLTPGRLRAPSAEFGSRAAPDAYDVHADRSPNTIEHASQTELLEEKLEEGASGPR